MSDDVLERFLRYVRIDTQGDESSDTYPSTARQLDLSQLLVSELQASGLEEVELTEHGYVFATLPGSEGAPVIGLIAHVDTTPETPGGGVVPIVHEDYGGGPIVLPGDPGQVIDPAEETALAARVGHDIVTSDGTTLLGADDKAGVAEIMAAVAYLRNTSEPRATVRVAFTVDEEVGHGTDHFDIEAFGAEAAYTLDGSGLGELEIETFSARQVCVTFRGRGVHPGSAKGKLVNAVKLAAEFVASLPQDSLSPETTEGREGFVHPGRISGGVEEASVVLIVRDHDDVLLDEHTERLRVLAEAVVEREPRARVTFETEESYRNMRAEIDKHPRVIAAAEEAIRRAGIEPVRSLIRGGTDGARLSEMGLPTPNIFTGGQSYHSLREWASVQDMAAAAATAVELVRVWAERD
ncbi:MAG: peptidase T [Thermoleophilia bacterium]|nr:peptidase T [Thermoleophilia bacterium]